MGIISLTNAAKNYTVRNVKVFKQVETTEEPEYFAQGSYEYNEKVDLLPDPPSLYLWISVC